MAAIWDPNGVMSEKKNNYKPGKITDYHKGKEFLRYYRKEPELIPKTKVFYHVTINTPKGPVDIIIDDILAEAAEKVPEEYMKHVTKDMMIEYK